MSPSSVDISVSKPRTHNNDRVDTERLGTRCKYTNTMTRLTLDNINHNVVKAEYAVRGELALKSEAYRHQLLDGVALPFDSIISCNIGNPQQLGQKPITFFRQVLSLLENPGLLEHHETLTTVLGYPEDVIERARWQLSQIGSVGAYSPSAGVPAFKGSIANFLESESTFLLPKDACYSKVARTRRLPGNPRTYISFRGRILGGEHHPAHHLCRGIDRRARANPTISTLYGSSVHHRGNMCPILSR